VSKYPTGISISKRLLQDHTSIVPAHPVAHNPVAIMFVVVSSSTSAPHTQPSVVSVWIPLLRIFPDASVDSIL